MLDFAIFAKGRADETDRITAVALNFEVKGKRFAFNGYRISILTSKIKYKIQNIWLQMKYKMTADQVLKRFARQIRKEDASKERADREPAVSIADVGLGAAVQRYIAEQKTR